MLTCALQRLSRKRLSVQPKGRVISAKAEYRKRTKTVNERQGGGLCSLLLPSPSFSLLRPPQTVQVPWSGRGKAGGARVLLFFPVARNSGKVKRRNITKHTSYLPHCLPLGPKSFPSPQPCIKLCPPALRFLECALLLSGQAFCSNAESTSLTFICSKPAHHSDLRSNVVPWGARSWAP